MLDPKKLTNEELKFLNLASEQEARHLDKGGYPLAEAGHRLVRKLTKECERRRLRRYTREEPQGMVW
jgi:hypothetical protein